MFRRSRTRADEFLMQLELSSDQQFFAETTRRFLVDHCPPAELRARRHDRAGFDTDYWKRGAELGWTSLLVTEEDGGGSISEQGLIDLSLVAFEFGRHASPGPLIPANVVAAALSRWGTVQQKEDSLPGLLSGELIATWGFAEPRPNDRLGTVACVANRTSGGYRLRGIKEPVEAAGQADQLLIAARTDEGLAHFLVAADLPGLTVTPMEGLDITRRYASIELADVDIPASALLGHPGTAELQTEYLLQVAVVLQLAEMVGAMDRSFEMTVEWAFSRYSFGRPLASYQALKHRFADMRAWLEAAHAIADAAAQHVQSDSRRASEYVSAGKSYLGVYGPELVQDCVQMHGGIGVTFDHDLHLYLRRVVIGSQLLGTVSDHRQRLASILESRHPFTSEGI
jgi:alkylation response protein AidB-like acyl-CoA dehydrogenase